MNRRKSPKTCLHQSPSWQKAPIHAHQHLGTIKNTQCGPIVVDRAHCWKVVELGFEWLGDCALAASRVLPNSIELALLPQPKNGEGQKIHEIAFACVCVRMWWKDLLLNLNCTKQYTINFDILVVAQGPTKPAHRGASQRHHGIGTRVCFCKHAIFMVRQRLEQFPKTQMVSFN